MTLANTPQYLNVIFHGMAMIAVPAEKGIRILVPHRDDHDYLWGKWCSESPMPKGRHQIAGVDPAHPPTTLPELWPNQNAVMQECPVNGPMQLHCEIHAPFPERIYSMRQVCKKPFTYDFFSGNMTGSLAQNPDTLSMVQAFRFKITGNVTYGGNSLQLTGENTNLHIWAEDAGHLVTGAAPTPVEDMVQQATGMSCTQNSNYHNRIGGLDPSESRPPGLQFYDLHTRGERSGPNCDDPPRPTDCCSDRFDVKIVHCMSLFVYHPR